MDEFRILMWVGALILVVIGVMEFIKRLKVKNKLLEIDLMRKEIHDETHNLNLDDLIKSANEDLERRRKDSKTTDQ